MKNKITNKKSLSKTLKDNNKKGRILDKKITVRLVVVLVTLLSLIIGASYAYFAVTGNNSATKAGIASTTGGVGTVALVNPTPNLHVNLTAGNMDEEVKGSILYGTDDVNLDYDEEEIPRSIAKATVVGGDDNVEYTCTFDLSVSLTGTMAEVLKANDASIIFSGIYEGVYDLTSPDLNRVITIRGLTGLNREENLYVVVKVNNKTTTQDYLQGKHLEIELSHSNFSCDMKTIENEEDTYTVVYNQKLPSEYQEVEYLESHGSEYILTDIIPNNQTGVYLKVASTDSSSNLVYFGSGTAQSDGFWIGNQSKRFYARWDVLYSKIQGNVLSDDTDVSNNVVYEYGFNYLNSRKITRGNTTYVENLQNLKTKTNPLTIIGYNNPNGGVSQIPAEVKIYELKISQGKDIVHNFVPCYRKSDGVRGLYDMATKTFYTNDGEGTFDIGAEVTNGYHETGSQQFVYGVSQNLLPNTYTVEGYTASGWTTKPNGGGKFYAEGALVNNLSSHNGEIINLYSKYEKTTILGAVLESNNYTKYTGSDTAAGDFSYYSGSANGKRNIVYNDICWQVIRTTDNKSVKMVYNGSATKTDDGNGNITYSCASGRANHVGYSGGRTIAADLNGNYYYGTDYEYDSENNVYRLVNETKTAMNYRTDYNELTGMYTCMKTTPNATCALGDIKLVVYRSGTGGSANVLNLVSNINYSEIGLVPYTLNSSSLATVGYMYNSVYNVSSHAPANGQIFGYGIENRTSAEQQDGLGKFKLVPKYENNEEVAGSYVTISNWSSDYNTINKAHYTCFNTTGICNTYYYVVYTSSSAAYYISTATGKTIEQLLDLMLSDSNVNTTNYHS